VIVVVAMMMRIVSLEMKNCTGLISGKNQNPANRPKHS
jgi:hypothetical protein